MATNRKFAQTNLTDKLPTATGLKSGAPYVVGKIPCVLLTDAEAASPYNATVQLDGIFSLSVQAESADIAVGDKLYYDADDVTTKLTNDASGNALYGYAHQVLTQVNSPAAIDVQVGVKS